MNKKQILKIATTLDNIEIFKLIKNEGIEEVVTCLLYKEKEEGKLIPTGYELRMRHKGMLTRYTRAQFKLKVLDSGEEEEHGRE